MPKSLKERTTGIPCINQLFALDIFSDFKVTTDYFMNQIFRDVDCLLDALQKMKK